MPSEQPLDTLQRLINREMGWYLAFPGHEDGGELEAFAWDEHKKGAFSPLNLLRAEGWMNPLEIDQVLAAWLKPEQTGAINGEAWLVPERDAAKILLSESVQAERSEVYQALLQLLQSQLQELQAFRLSCDPAYALVVLVGQAEGRWLTVTSQVPVATQILEDAPIQFRVFSLPVAEPTESEGYAAIEQQIQVLLSKLGTVQLYGYYGGGYHQIHDYNWLVAAADTREQSIEQAVAKAGLLTVGEFQTLQPNLTNAEPEEAAKFQQLAQVLQALPQLWVYRFSFWNYEHFYIVGRATANLWCGVVLRSRFTYNP